MRTAFIRAEELDVRDPRCAETGLADLAAALGRPIRPLSDIADLLLSRGAGHFDRHPLSFDEALSLSLASDLAAAGCEARDAARAVRLHWPEVARVVLEHDRVRSSPEPEPRRRLAVSGALTPPPLLEAVDAGEPPPSFGRFLHPAPTLAAVRDLFGEAAWASGTGRLRRLFGEGQVILPDEGSASDMPSGQDFLSEGPYWDRLAAVLRADVPNLFGAKGPIEARRLRCQIDYLMEPPPIDQWKCEVGTAKVLPRVKHLIEVIANVGEVELSARSHPETLKMVDPEDAVGTLRGYLDVLGLGEPA